MSCHTCVLDGSQQQPGGDAGGDLVVVVHLPPTVLKEAVGLLEHQDEDGRRAEVGLVPVGPHELQVCCPLENIKMLL